MIRVSFDFDYTLGEHEAVQEYAEELVRRGVEVWITTRRPDDAHARLYDWNVDLNAVADRIGISRGHINHLNLSWKHEKFAKEEFLWHLDDDDEEVQSINLLTNTKCFWVYDKDWKNKCEKLLKENG